MSKDALSLYYDIPVDRIAARLLCKSPEFQALPEKARNDLIVDPPRIKPQDIMFIFDRAPWNNERQQPEDHRGKHCGAYFVIGYAGNKYSYQDKGRRHGGRQYVRCGKNFTMSNWGEFRGIEQKRSTMHHWWVREPDGTISSMRWSLLRRLLPNETVEMFSERKRLEKEAKL